MRLARNVEKEPAARHNMQLVRSGNAACRSPNLVEAQRQIWTQIAAPQHTAIECCAWHRMQDVFGSLRRKRAHLYRFCAALLASCWAEVRFFHLLTFSLVRLKKPWVPLLALADPSALLPVSALLCHACVATTDLLSGGAALSKGSDLPFLGSEIGQALRVVCRGANQPQRHCWNGFCQGLQCLPGLLAQLLEGAPCAGPLAASSGMRNTRGHWVSTLQILRWRGELKTA